jgi:Flp pilus assembly protein TadG
MRRTASAPLRRRSGKVVIFVALCLTGMVGVVALAVDGGVLLDGHQQLQAAADAAALAAATDLFANYVTNQGADPSGTAAQSALTTAAANGFSSDSNGTTVTVNIPPQSGAFSGQAGYAEVLIQHKQNRYFSTIFGKDAITVTARSVARGTQKPYVHASVLVLDPSGQGAYTNSGDGFQIAGAPILINSNSSQAALLSGSGTVLAPQINIVGNYAASGDATLLAKVSTGVKETSDPLSKLSVPSNLKMESNSPVAYSRGRYTLQPGIYNGGIALSSSAEVALEPGVYYLNGGGLTVSGRASLIGRGVLIYNDPFSNTDAINISGRGAISLSPPTSGAYAGLTFFQNRTSPVALSLSGGNNMSISGTIYAPAARLNINGNGDSTMGSQFITADLTTTGDGILKIPWNIANVCRARDLRLVE